MFRNCAPDGSVAVTATRSYDAYGAVRSSSGTSASSHKFCGGLGHTTDATGLIYMRARYYDPAIGRFASEDPAGDGLDWYAYCGGDPVGGADPWGLDVCSGKKSRGPKKKHGRSPDYYDVALNIGSYLGAQIVIDVDPRSGQQYIGVGPYVGTPGISVEPGWIGRGPRDWLSSRPPSAKDRDNYLNQGSWNLGGGYFGGGDLTYGGNGLWGAQGGFTSPGGSLSWTYSWRADDFNGYWQGIGKYAAPPPTYQGPSYGHLPHIPYEP